MIRRAEARKGWRVARLLAAATVLTGTAPTVARAVAANPPRLTVVISVDQFGSGLFARYRDRFRGGFARLARGGVVFANAYQSHAVTETCAGHSTLLTGVHPNRTGITGNYWFTPGAAKETYCLASTEETLAHDPAAEGRGPGRLMATTLGDWMKAAGKGTVVSVGGKDRSAITMAGHRPDGVFWYDDAYRGFTTYVAAGQSAAARLAPVDAINARLRRTATARPPQWRYADPSCRALEGDFDLGTARWKASVPPQGWSATGTAATAARAFRTSPFLDLATLEAARDLLGHYRLGLDDTPDLLTVGLSATDAIGHAYGAGGPEMCDHLFRLDAALGRFLDAVYATTPDAMVVLTADHGGSDFPERLRQTGYPGAIRMNAPAFLRSLNDAVAAKLGLPFAPFVVTERGYAIDQIYLATPTGAPFPADRRTSAVAAGLDWLRGRPEVAAAHAREELLVDPKPMNAWPEGLTLRQRMAESAYPGRSGDIMVAYQPLTTLVPAAPGLILAGHGSPWDYDRRVPLIFLARSLAARERPIAVETVDIAPTLAAFLDVPAPKDLDGRCLGLVDGASCGLSR